jgi:hypothetical protein
LTASDDSGWANIVGQGIGLGDKSRDGNVVVMTLYSVDSSSRKLTGAGASEVFELDAKAFSPGKSEVDDDFV